MDKGTQSAPFLLLDDDNRGAVVAIVAIIGLLVTFSVIVSKLVFRPGLHLLRSYDYSLFAGLLFLLVHEVLVIYSATLGLGKHVQALDKVALDSLRKAQFTTSIFEILVFFSTKISICWFIETINSFSHIRRANRVLIGLVIICFVVGLLGTAFRCQLPTSWLADSPTSCPAAGPIQSFVLISSLVTDTLIFLVAFMMIVPVQTSFQTKCLIIGLFSMRLLCAITVAPVLPRISYVYNGAGTDFSWDAVIPTISLTIASHLAVITACIPSLKGVFDSWLGNTFGIDIDAPYQLERIQDKSGFAVTEYDAHNQNSSSRSGGGVRSRLRGSKPGHLESCSRGSAAVSGEGSGRKLNSGGGGLVAASVATLKLTTSSPTGTACFAGNQDGNSSRNHREILRGSGHAYGTSSRKQDEDRSESVKGLTDGVIMIHSDVEVRFDDRDASSCSSRG
ncbi:hypothetical protein Micbo1qcDRAFT_229597 [Microdochium bolleyi]|uniref:Rhodopsin domain-containing protein n=1 Tax=Microdochium bolleyi TaxID=196109 RepID=A0A136JI11_9PEZI|nr:hypothetical protein Micbo1qcDRAFT_229597 [Microdochium bolleyi]